MCVAANAASFSDTKIYVGDHEYNGKQVRVLAYQNKAENKYQSGKRKKYLSTNEARLLGGRGVFYNYGDKGSYIDLKDPNAMLLHIPSKEPMGPKNFIDSTGYPRWLDDMCQQFLYDGTRGGSRVRASKNVQVFEVGSYHVVLAKNGMEIPGALELVPENKRPTIKREIFQFYTENYPDYTIALCCFDGDGVFDTEPIALWYEPRHPDILEFPAVDCHTGYAPNLDAMVEVDHWLFTNVRKDGLKIPWKKQIPENMAPFIPDRVIGYNFDPYFYPHLNNGDFAILKSESWKSDDPWKQCIHRLHPRYGFVQQLHRKDMPYLAGGM